MKLSDRMKNYENAYRLYLTCRTPVIVRVDGRAFHTFTRSLDKPFDARFMECMVKAATDLAGDMQGFKAAYIQSDEASFLLTDYDSIESESWFGNNLSKIVSISSAMMSVRFNEYFKPDKGQVFDARAFNVPQDDVVNYFLWRAKDWQRNSLSMYTRSFFSHKQLNNKKASDMHDLLHSIGKNWTTDLDPQKKNGTFLLRNNEGNIIQNTEIHPSYEFINDFLGLK